MKIVVAPQEFKGSLTASQAAAAIAAGARQTLPRAVIVSIPMADGGPGTVEAVVAAADGETLRTTVRDSLGRPVEALWGIVGENTAVIEMAAAGGLWRLADYERDPCVATTYGVGELVQTALAAGCRRLVIGLGGSATNDGGAGMAQALGVRLLDADGAELPLGGAALAMLERIDVSNLDPRVQLCDVTAAADVTNPLCGPEGASLVYGPQKGASPAAARELDGALHRYAELVERDVGAAVRDEPGAGAAGGLGAGLIAFLEARIEPGVEVVAKVVNLRDRLRGADLLLTGEGRLDGQTGYGKTVAGVARIAAAEGVPVVAVAGSLGNGWEGILKLGVDAVEAIVPRLATVNEAMTRPDELLASTSARAVRGWLRMIAIAGETDA